MKHRKPRKGIAPLSPPKLVDNPFVSRAQQRACYAQDDPAWDCHEWSQATKGKKLPERAPTKNTSRITRNKRKLACNKSSLLRNAINPSKLDPTRTLTLRRSFFQELRKRFARLKGALFSLIVKEDVFGLKEQPNPLLTNSAEPDPELEQEKALFKIGAEVYKRKDSPDYGKLFFKSETQEVWYETADGDEREFTRWLGDKLNTIPLIRKVRIEAESSPPQDEGWIQYYPKYKKWVTNCQPGQMRGADGKCGPGIGISVPRNEMPQIKNDDLQSFLSYAQSKGVNVHKESATVSDLSPTQSEFRQERVDSLPDAALLQPILTSSDQYILDGTHRWIKAWQKDKGASVPILMIDLPLQDSLDLMRSFPKVVYAENVSHIDQISNTRWQFHNDPQKLRAFQSWLDSQIKSDLIGDDSKHAWDNYIQAGYKKGAGRSFDDTKKSIQGLAIGDQRKLDFYAGSRDEFLRSTFAQPVAREKVELLAQRAFDEMENVTSDMSTKISRTLTDGLVEGKSPNDVADDLLEQVDISATRAKTIARSELIRSHAEGQLTALESLGVEEVGVAVEWSVSGLNTFDKRGNPISPCARCKAMDGVVLKISEARNLIPLHPNCSCCFLPANVGEDNEDQKSSKEQIDSALEEADVELEVDEDRPESIINVFLSSNTNPEQARDAQGRFTSSGESLNEHEQTAQRSADKTSELFGIPKKDVQFHRIEGDRTYGEYSSDNASLVNVHTGQPINRQLNMHKHLDRTVTEGEHLAAHETVHQAYSADSELGKQTQERLSKVNAEYGHSVSMYGAMSGHFENLIELGAVYSHSPEALKKYSPEMYNIAHEWVTKLKGSLTTNTNPNHDEQGKFASSQFAHLNDSSLKRMAKKAGIKHDGSREDIEQKLHEYMNPGTKETDSGLKGRSSDLARVSPNVPSVAETKPTTFDKAQSASAITESTKKLGQENYNLVHLGDLRSAHPNLSKDQFDQALKHAQSSGKLSLIPAEGRHGVSEHDQQSMIHEPDPVTGLSHSFLYASVRNILSPYVDNVFCATGQGGGIDSTCSPRGVKYLKGRGKDILAQFTHGGHEYNVHISYDQGIYHVIFARGKSQLAKTGDIEGGGAVPVFRAVGEVVEKFIQERKPNYFEFSADKTEQSRVDLYRTMSRLLGKRHGYDVQEDDSSDGKETEFSLTKKREAIRNTRSFSEEFDISTINYLNNVENVFCPKGKGGGVDPTCSPSVSHQHIQDVIGKAETKAGKDFTKVREALKHMPEAAREHLARGLEQIVVVNDPDPDKRYKNWKQAVIDHKIDQDLSPNTAHAFYTHETKAALVRPIPKQMIEKGGAKDEEEMLWHEMGHALDFSPEDTSFSWHKDWQAAWKKEIGDKAGGKISEYASVSPEEGFAEMHRLLCQYRGQGKKGDTALKKIEKDHPLCVKYWKDNNLW